MVVKTSTSPLKMIALAVIIAFAGAGVSCMTTYDAYGRPVQSVDPGAAAAGVAAAGIIGYAAGQDSDRYRGHSYYGGGRYYHRGPYRGPRRAYYYH